MVSSPLPPLSLNRIVPKICVAAGILLLVVGIYLTRQLLDQYDGRSLPGVFVDTIDVGGKDESEIRQVLNSRLAALSQRTITVTVDGQEFPIPSLQLDLSADESDVVGQVLMAGRDHYWQDGVWRILLGRGSQIHIRPDYTFSGDKVRLLIEALKQKVDVAGKDPQATLAIAGRSESLSVTEGMLGQEISAAQAFQALQNVAGQTDSQVRITLVKEVAGKRLSPPELTEARLRAEKLVGKQLTLKMPDRNLTVSDQQMVAMLAFPSGLSDTGLANYAQELSTQVTREAQNAQLEYDADTLKVKTFTPPRDGLQLDALQLQSMLREQVSTLELSDSKTTELTLPLAVKKPTSNLSDTNDLGIVERIGFGDSKYFHSAAGRIHNVALAAERINNIIVKPGEEFSFIKAIGEISQATGYKQAYIIRAGRTELGDGGGVCQVSTTVFRSLLNAGLPITSRKAHSFRVSYYELNSKPGVDATVYPGSADLKFTNDTGHHLLLHTQTDSQNLYMTTEIYGTSDGRTTEIVDHKTWAHVGPGPAQYIDDPSLPPGKIKQVETAVSGIKASFKNIVRDRNGNITSEKEYFSNYVPWRAIYMRGI